jgi:hypothetical protein
MASSCGDARAKSADRPADGDLVILRTAGSETHTLSTCPSLPQIRCDTQAEAVRHARRFAVRQGVDAWLADEEGRYSRVSHHRRPTRLVLVGDQDE